MLLSNLSERGPGAVSEIYRISELNKALNMAQEYPDFPTDNRLIKKVMRHLEKKSNRYAPVEGVLELREQIAEKIQSWYSHMYHPETEITITAGATQAISTAISTFIDEGDEVLVFEPAYESYVPSIIGKGGNPSYVRLKGPDYKIDWDEVSRGITNRTRMIILNSPNNPTCNILSAYDMERLQRLTQGTRILILSDEVFEHIIYDGLEHQSIARFPELVKKSIIVSSFGKTLNISGWKIGYCLAPVELSEKFRLMHQFQIQSVSAPFQYAIADHLKTIDDFAELRTTYQTKRNQFSTLLKGSKFETRSSAGTYFQLLDYSSVSEENDIAVALRLANDHKISTIPLSVYYHDYKDSKQLRICFARPDATLEKAARILRKVEF